MPYVNIRVAGKLDRQQKEEICSGVTDVIARVANKPKDSILIFIDEDQHEISRKAGSCCKNLLKLFHELNILLHSTQICR